MKYLFILLFVTNCFSQEKINQFDQNGLKHGLWNGVFAESKRMRFEGTFDHGVEIGVFNFYDDSDGKILLSTRTFSNEGTVAMTVFFDKNKMIISQGKTINKLHEGEWKYFHDGTTALMITENYSKGKLIGSRKVFFLNQQIAEESTYKNGKKEGVYKKYTEKGTLLEESFFKNGEYNGLAIFRDSDGNIASKGPFVNGLKKGKWQFFEAGKLKKELVLPIVKKMANRKKKVASN